MDSFALGKDGPWCGTNYGSSALAEGATTGRRHSVGQPNESKDPQSIQCVLFNHAIRCEWLEQGRNPIKLVRQSAKRKSTPEVLDPNEIQGLLLQLDSCFRLMVMLDVTTGLRRSELFALKWLDVDFSNLTIDVQRSIYLGKIGNCKTEASRKPVPLDERVAADLWL